MTTAAKSMVWRTRLSFWQRHRWYRKRLWQGLRMPELRLSSFIQRMVLARYKSCKWLSDRRQYSCYRYWWKLWWCANKRSTCSIVALRENWLPITAIFISQLYEHWSFVPQIVYYVYAYAQLSSLVRLWLRKSQFHSTNRKLEYLGCLYADKLVCQLANWFKWQCLDFKTRVYDKNVSSR